MAEAPRTQKGGAFYAIVGGRTGNCIVRTWPECRVLVSGWSGARCAKCGTMAEAIAFLGRPEGALEQGQEPNRFYAVAGGRGGFRGVVDSWAECRKLVNGVPRAQHRAFPDRGSAAAWLAKLDAQGRGV